VPPWLLIGDFNEVMWPFEHFSARRRPEKQMMDFRDTLTYCDVHDIGFSGMPWTYDNKQRGTETSGYCWIGRWHLLAGRTGSRRQDFNIWYLLTLTIFLSSLIWTMT
jgi:hypothetical protein